MGRSIKYSLGKCLCIYSLAFLIFTLKGNYTSRLFFCHFTNPSPLAMCIFNEAGEKAVHGAVNVTAAHMVGLLRISKVLKFRCLLWLTPWAMVTWDGMGLDLCAKCGHFSCMGRGKSRRRRTLAINNNKDRKNDIVRISLLRFRCDNKLTLDLELV